MTTIEQFYEVHVKQLTDDEHLELLALIRRGLAAESAKKPSQLAPEHPLTAQLARRIADRALFSDLVGCALSSGEPIWIAGLAPRWRIPYQFFDGTLFKVVDVDAYTATVSVTPEERALWLGELEQVISDNYAPA